MGGATRRAALTGWAFDRDRHSAHDDVAILVSTISEKAGRNVSDAADSASGQIPTTVNGGHDRIVRSPSNLVRNDFGCYRVDVAAVRREWNRGLCDTGRGGRKISEGRGRNCN